MKLQSTVFKSVLVCVTGDTDLYRAVLLYFSVLPYQALHCTAPFTEVSFSPMSIRQW